MPFSTIRDQDVPVRYLKNVISSRRVPNAMLFWGPGGVGKQLAARNFAMALNCKESAPDACGACLSCRKIEAGNHPDVKFVAPSGKSRSISVETTEAVIDMAYYRPFEGSWRINVILDADRMHPAAQNHFLKTLEEPPSATSFVLVSEFPRRLLPTIRSRCQQMRFGALRRATVAALLLEHRNLPEAVAGAIAALSQGQMARAYDLVDSGKRDAVLDVTQRLGQGEDPLVLSMEFGKYLASQAELIRNSVKEDAQTEDPNEASREQKEEAKKDLLATAEGLVRREWMEVLYLFSTWYRDIQVFHATRDASQVLNLDKLDILAKQADTVNDAHLPAIEKAWLYLERNIGSDRVFRDLFFTLAPERK